MKDITVQCIVCNEIGILKNFGELMALQNTEFEFYTKRLSDKRRKDIDKIAQEVRLSINPKAIRKLLKANQGIFKVFCRLCMAKLSEISYSELGDNVVRTGNMLFGKQFLEEHEDEYRKMISEKDDKGQIICFRRF